MTHEAKPISIMLIESLAMIVLIILLICDFFKYFLNIDLINLTLSDLIKWFKTPESTTSTTKPSSTTSSSTTSSSTTPSNTTFDEINSAKNPTCISSSPTSDPSSEVFNIRNNIYTYDEAKTVCSIYGAKLATYDQVEKAYDLGGEWCNYGWSDGQMALFPTQKSTWSNYKKTLQLKINAEDQE
jgi:hypothetical protein